MAENAYHCSAILKIHFSILKKIIDGGEDVPFGAFNTINNKQPTVQSGTHRCLIDKGYTTSTQLAPLFQVAL
jgi:hypothetical protein